VSLDAQRERIGAYCVAQGFELVGLERDNGVSGKVAPHERQGLKRALEAIKHGEADGIIATKLDRLSRSVRDVLDLADSAAHEGWRLVSLSESLDTDTSQGRFTLTILAALAQLERERISERVGEALDHVARQGRARSRFTPFGWRTPSGKETTAGGGRVELVPHAAEQAALGRLVVLRGQGLGARRIAATLNREGPNPRSRRPWAAEGVATILRRLERWEAAGVPALATQ
jgi:site-specific DNA recombinase